MSIHQTPSKVLPFRAHIRINGKKTSKCFATRSAAELWEKSMLRENSLAELAISPAERLAIIRIRDLVSGDFSGLISRLEKEASDKAALSVRSSVDFEFAIDRYLSAGSTDLHWSRAHAHNVRYVLRRFADAFAGPNTTPADITAIHVQSYLDHRISSDSMRKHHASILRTFWAWLVRQSHAPSTAPTDAITFAPSPRKLTGRKPLLPAAQVFAFLDACAALAPDLLPVWTLRFGSGIRAEEITRVQWSATISGAWYGIDPTTQEIHLAPQWTKSGRYRRLYDLPDWVWSRLASCVPDASGFVLPRKYLTGGYNSRHWFTAIQSIREKASIPDASFTQNIARHTFASYAYHRGLEWAMDMMGHADGSRVFHAHYKGNATPSESAAFFAG